MIENDGTFRFALLGVSGSGSSEVVGSEDPTPQKETSSPREPVKDLGLVDWSYVRLAAFRIARDLTVSYDIAQQVCARLLALSPERREAIQCLQAYSAQAARNEARNWLRSRARVVPADELTEMPAGEHFDPALIACHENEVLHALAMLPERLQVPFILCKMFDYTAEEAAAKLGISVEAVWKRIQGAFKILSKGGLRSPASRKSRTRSVRNRKEQQ